MSESIVRSAETATARPAGEYILIPAYNEASQIAEVIGGLAARGFANVVVVDDGSADDTARVANEAGAIVLRHPINCGAGAATATGFAYLRGINVTAVATFDGDGQHDPDDLPALFAPIYENEVDVVVGSRMFDPKGMPLFRRLAQRAATLSTFLLFGQWSTDTQSGLKAFSRRALETIQIRTNRFEVCSEIIAEIRRRKLIMSEVPITVIYTSYSMSKGQGPTVGIRTLARLIIDRILRF